MRDDRSGFHALPPGESEGHPHAHGPNPLKLAHRCLRGRYLVAIGLGALLSAPLAFVAYRAVPPMYESQALLQIRSRIEPTVYQMGDEQIPAFESFKQTQAQYIMSRRTLDLASDMLTRRIPDRWTSGPAGAGRLANGLKVGVPRVGEVLTVSVTHRDPGVAREATDAVLEAYLQLFGEGSALTRSQTERNLDTEVRRLSREIAESQSRIAQLSERFGTDDLLPYVRQKTQQIADLDRRIDEIRIALTTAAAREQDGSEDPGDTIRVEDLPLETLAQSDPFLGDRISLRRALQTELQTRLLRLGEGHREVRAIRDRLRVIDNEITDRVRTLQVMVDDGSVQIAPRGVVVSGTPAQLTAQLEEAMRLRDVFRQEQAALNQTRNQIQAERDAIARLEQLNRGNILNLEKLRAENRNADIARVVVVQPGDTPVSPSTDRRLPLAAAGGMAGFGLGVGLIGLMGFLRTGVRYIDDFEPFLTRTQLIGVVPDLDDDAGDGSAALSVHHLRNLLHVARVRDGGGPRVYTLTSPTSGDGKTSLTYALGLSFAAVGQRTLVVDADLVASGLTRQLDLDGTIGLWEALDGAELSESIHPTTSQTLFAMPIGASRDTEPERLGGDRLTHVLEAVRERFDVVLIDTGPLLGSLDASLAASASDEVILTVASGQRTGLIRAALSRLDALHARCAGIVFNRASWSDLKGSISPASLNSWSIRSVDPRQGNGQASAHSRKIRGRLTASAEARGVGKARTNEPAA